LIYNEEALSILGGAFLIPRKMKEVKILYVFNYELSGSDAEAFCRKSPTEKFAWIRKNVPSVSEEDINHFLSQELKYQKPGCGCSPVSETKKTAAVTKPKKEVTKDHEPDEQG
jgi:hypothetical protein